MIISLIMTLFLWGDVVDNISNENPKKEIHWSCLYLLGSKYIPDNIIFKEEDDNECFDPNVVSLPSTLGKIKFCKKRYNEIVTRVKFFAGNSECDIQDDLIFSIKNEVISLEKNIRRH